MPEQRVYGLEYIKIGDPVSGGMATTLAALGVTYENTAELVQDDDEVTDIFSEENVDPEESFVVAGSKRMNWSIMNYDPDEVVKVLGGTATGTAPNKTWNSPTAAVNIEKSIEFKTKDGRVVKIARAKISGKLNWQIRKNGVALIDISAKVLVPTDGTTAPIQVTNPAI